MDVQNSGTGHIFSLPVALIFQNGSGFEESAALGYDAANATETNSSWKKTDYANGVHRMEKIGETLRKDLKWAFILHTYGFGCIFFILAFYTFFSILNLRSFISSRPFMSTINGFLCLLGSSRAASLFIDPYNLKENMPKLIGQVLWDLGFPSLISAFCLVQLAFIQLTQLCVGPAGLRRKSCLSLVITAHFLVTIGMDIIIASNENFTVVKLVVQYIFLTWGVFLCSNFLYSGYKIMSMIRNMSAGLIHRDLPESSYKGIMQLAILAPRNNLAGSMTAALIPTLCTPKIHQQDSLSLSAVGFKHDGNSRILESESIPMLEELMTSSGDETSQKPLARGSSFQNQTRNTQKFNLKPKLSLKSSEDGIDDELGEVKSNIKSPKSMTQKIFQNRQTELNFYTKTSNGILKNTENLEATKSIYEFTPKLKEKTSFENENFHFSKDKKWNLINDEEKVEREVPQAKDITKDNIISKPSESFEPFLQKNSPEDKEYNVTKNDLNDVKILRNEKNCEEFTDIDTSKSEKSSPAGEKNPRKNKQSGCLTVDCKNSCSNDEKEDQISNGGKKTSIRETDSTPESPFDGQSFLSSDSKLDHGPMTCQKSNRRNKTKSLSWKKKDSREQEEENGTQECLLPQENPEDLTKAVLGGRSGHANRCPQSNLGNQDSLEKDEKSKVEWVLNITYVTAMWGLMLCLSNMGRIYSPFDEDTLHKSPRANATDASTGTESAKSGIFFSSWPWLWFQTFCRALELAMGCAMANISRQPTANRRYPRMFGLRHRDVFYNIYYDDDFLVPKTFSSTIELEIYLEGTSTWSNQNLDTTTSNYKYFVSRASLTV